MSEEEYLEKANQYLEKVLEANKITNVTRITDADTARILHIEDSLVGLPEVQDAPEGLLGDLGSGGGFPGVPLALATGRPTVLVDSVGKKMALVHSLLEEMGLDEQIETSSERIEDLGRFRSGEFSVVTARALSKLVSLLELAAPLLKMGGRLVCYKAKVSEEELDDALRIEELVGMKLVSRRETVLSDRETARTILVFEKVSRPKLKLPRRVGLAQKQPLKPRL
ncbi:16S rRNA (guanine(527)-N(7))-methyltransferase RsmG [uncultured Adlercreutzia sp.]|uniref:16S rRNA (guanine(527)-N(7))-methyltransferase RsmG n=1 Tax=uncultured Adlercreutzia sp. TaxID=875803 RepID=UPI0025D6AAB5|nr:16S rRNA (guanine(527)-N(7))-methyltransferase RsmG [uncultured Adlercreutzia sp.]